MINLSDADKQFIKEELKPYLEKDNIEGVLRVLVSNGRYCSNVSAFLYELGLPLLDFVERVPDELFCSSAIEKVHIPSNVRTVGVSAFNWCKHLTEVTFEEGLEGIFDYAFSHTALAFVHLPKTMLSVGDSAFKNCKNLIDVTFEEGIKRIWDSAFYDTSLMSVTLPSTVHLVGDFAFGGIPSLSLTINSDVHFYEHAFQGSDVHLYVPKDIYENPKSNLHDYLSSRPDVSFDKFDVTPV